VLLLLLVADYDDDDNDGCDDGESELTVAGFLSSSSSRGNY